MYRLRTLLLVLFVIGGIGGNYFISETVRHDARKNWEAQATQLSQWLSGNLLGWLEESYTPLSGLAALFENSNYVSEAEFLNAFDGLEARSSAFFLEAAGMFKPVKRLGRDQWIARYSSHADGVFSPDAKIEDFPAISETISVAKARFGEVVVGRPIELQGMDGRALPVALGTFDSQGEIVLVGLVDYESMIKGLFDLHVPTGLALKIAGKFPAVDGQSQKLPVMAQPQEQTLYQVTTRTVSAGAELAFTWSFNSDYLGGPPQDFANFTLYGGMAGILAVSLYLALLLQRNKVISHRVKEATQELSEKEAMLRMTLENIPGGMAVTGKDMKLRLINPGFADLMGYPQELAQPGVRHEDILHYMGQHGFFGENVDIEKSVAEVLESVRNPTDKPVQYETPDGRFVEVRRRKSPEGDIISVALDITETKLAEQQIEQQRSQLNDILSNIQQGIVLFDKDKNLVAWNAKYPDVIGVNETLLKPGLPLFDLALTIAQRGDYGDGNVMEIARQRVESLYEDDFRSDATFGSDQIYEVVGSRTPAGGLVITYTDITERKASAAQIEYQRAQLDDILNNIHQGVVLADKDRRIIAWNAQYPELMNIDDDFLKQGMPGIDLVLRFAKRGDYGEGDPLELAQQRMDHIWSGDNRADISFGDDRSLEVHSTLTPDGGVIITYSDITERKLAEQKIETQRAQLDDILSNVQQGVVVFDQDKRLVTWNARFPIMVGVDEKELSTGISAFKLAMLLSKRGDYGDANIEELARERIAQIWESNTRVDVTYKDGQSCEVQSSLTPDGGAILTYTDITERKKAEHQIESQRAQLDDILSNVQQGVALFSSDRKLEAWNARFPTMVNLDPAKLYPGQSLFELTMDVAKRGDYGDATPEEMARQRIDQLWNEETRTDMTFSDGRTCEVHSSLTPEGGVIITYTDITGRKKNERIIAKAMGEINDSIQYASRIQRSVLPSENELKEAFKDQMVIWEPRDVVGGDLLLFRECFHGNLLMLMDCTGHGVPGAIMTMIVTGAFDQALQEIPSGDPAKLLTSINQIVKNVLGQIGEEGESDDGFECGLCLIDQSGRKITYAGARFELWCFDNGEVTITKGDKVGIGYRRTSRSQAFTNHSVFVSDTASYYMISDGIVDQIGGKKRRGYGKRRLKQSILDYSRMDMKSQGIHILRAFKEYQHDEEQRDDVSLVGFKPLTSDEDSWDI